jgi:hypothetical protein
VILAGVLGVRTASADDHQCVSAIDAWLKRCESVEHLRSHGMACRAGRAFLDLEAGTDVLRVEVTRDTGKGFRQIRGVALSPIVETADWSKAPPAVIAAFEGVCRCVQADPSIAETLAQAPPPPTGQPAWRAAPLSYPWRLGAGVFAALLALALGLRRGRVDWRRVTLAAGALAGLTLVSFVARALLLPPAFFHQNGAGAFWIDSAACGTSPYGPGYAQLFGALVRWSAEPEASVFLGMSVLCAPVPAMLWLLVRHAGARPLLAWSIAIAFAAHPVVCRLARSESYYSLNLALIVTAAAVLAVAARRRRLRSPSLVLGVVASGLLIAQAALVHPTAWIASALVPLVILVRGGSLRRRLLVTATAGLGIGLVVLVAAAPGMHSVLSQRDNMQWAERGGLMWGYGLGLTLRAMAAGAAVLWLSPRRRRPWAAVAVMVAVLTVELSTNLFGNDRTWAPPHAWMLLFVPAFAAGLVATLRALERRKLSAPIAAAVLVLGLGWDIARWKALTMLPTDALEAQLMLRWRDQLPRGATLVYLSKVGHRNDFLPTRARCPAGPRSVEEVEPGETVPAVGEMYYFRTAICSTREGRPVCEGFERTHRLEPLQSARLPARPSMPGLDYDEAHVEVGLYRVRAGSDER